MATLTDEQKAGITMLADGLSTPPVLPVLRTPKEVDIAFEDVEFVTKDGIKVTGWLMKPEGAPKGVVISNHFSPGNKYGFAGHMEGLGFAGGFEVNFLPRYKALVDAGYVVLAYDLRGHGGSDAGEGGISGVGFYEWQEVLASLDFVKSREDTKDLNVNLYSMCMGANATYNAMDKNPEAFSDVKCWVCVAPLKGQTAVERNFENMGLPMEESMKFFEEYYTKKTGMTVENHNVMKLAGVNKLPTFFLQVRNDMGSRASDVQWIFDNTAVEDKKIVFVEDTPWRFKGYTYFSEKPEDMVAWFDAHN